MDPPVPFHEFEHNYSFPSFMSPPPGLYPDLGDPLFPPPPIPGLSGTSNALFSATEQTNLLGFLDSFEWDFDPQLPAGLPSFSPLPGMAPLMPSSQMPQQPPPPISTNTSSSLYNAIPLGPSSSSSTSTNSYASSTASTSSAQDSSTSLETMAMIETLPQVSPLKRRSSSRGDGSRAHPAPLPSHVPAHARQAKPLLSTPQKRLNHIMSEQKRRNTIREGYSTLTTLLAPEGGTVPRNARPPRGRGARGRGRGKGKSGVLFRAAEYCRWLEEGVDALIDEVERVESMALQMRALDMSRPS